MQNYSDFMFTF